MKKNLAIILLSIIVIVLTSSTTWFYLKSQENSGCDEVSNYESDENTEVDNLVEGNLSPLETITLYFENFENSDFLLMENYVTESYYIESFSDTSVAGQEKTKLIEIYNYTVNESSDEAEFYINVNSVVTTDHALYTNETNEVEYSLFIQLICIDGEWLINSNSTSPAL